jgi:hypothetical protein
MSKHDIFICYSSKDESQARVILQNLEARGFKCWISSRDVRPGRNYQESIVRAIEDAKVIVFLLSDFSNKTSEVKKELSLASTFEIAVIPLRLTATKPNSALLYELSTRQWIDVFPDLEASLDLVVSAIEETLRAGAGGDTDRAAHVARGPAPAAGSPRPEPTAAPSPRRASGIAIGDQERDAIRPLLAHHVGPIAKVLIERAAAGATTRDEFCEKLAAHIPTPADRATFLRTVRARLTAAS